MFGRKQKWLRASKWIFGIGIVLFVGMLAVYLTGVYCGRDGLPFWALAGMLAGAAMILITATVLGILELWEEIVAKPKRALLYLLAEFAILFFIYLLVIVVFRKEVFSWLQALSWCWIIIAVDKTLAYYQRYHMEKKGR
ncbi:MAG: hypothetical protein HFI42_12005 [Lachnospiraceae bacterium]|nr:hypothetical protein [Lachnospiraceae bacterium]MCI9151195.1 hypothetical protein [Lachnospiraceae bacterium]